ncbi:WxL domain-containing protein [Levilactobacillus parabrevis]|uniref:WxL domain-containing protein n=1 Tax=Levilactobacillus parabrevis TaxID=357278 RepID=UPI0021A804C3|nr:WxL domain-containing protein [Levilactobacillus parabrevis]MCT4487848.1 hypothetical protein [Levilactobacillus parabrevis]MCT4490162.1 hypothetical protein [Levilactobacillus parabrevis]
MTKKTLQLIATVALAAGFGFTTVTANADTTDASSSSNSQTTTATVGLTAPTTDPDGPHSGQIQLVAAPDLVFGDATKGTEITGAQQTISATSLKTNAKSTSALAANADKYPGVKDGDVAVVNPGTSDSWTVTVQAANFVKSGTTDTNLLGATINFKGGAETTNADPAAKTKAAIAEQPNVVAGGDAATILSATSGNGVGTWMNRLTTDTNLSISGGNVAGTYASDLTWTVANTPSTQA